MSATPDFKERLNKISLRNRGKTHKRHANWPIEKKIEVVSQYLVLGNMKLVAATTGVSHDLIRQWKTQPWWMELEGEIRLTQNIEMDTKLSKIVDRSLDAVVDRLENGEYIYDPRTGNVKRKPASLRDVARVSVDILSKRELLRGNATERKETTQVSVQEQLKLLAVEFAKWQNNKAIDVEMVEVIEDQDAIHEEREEGLQEGSSLVYVEASGEEEASGTERSSSGDGESGPSPQG